MSAQLCSFTAWASAQRHPLRKAFPATPTYAAASSLTIPQPYLIYFPTLCTDVCLSAKNYCWHTTDALNRWWMDQQFSGARSQECPDSSSPQLSRAFQHVQHQNAVKTDKQHQTHICTTMFKCDQINYFWTAFVSLLNKIQFLQLHFTVSNKFFQPHTWFLISWFFTRVWMSKPMSVSINN